MRTPTTVAVLLLLACDSPTQTAGKQVTCADTEAAMAELVPCTWPDPPAEWLYCPEEEPDHGPWVVCLDGWHDVTCGDTEAFVQALEDCWRIARGEPLDPR